jgi:glycosyltransferase involved in cell wall biosynthesis
MVSLHEAAQVPIPDKAAARSLLGLADVPTVVALGPFDDPAHIDQLRIAVAAVRRHCAVQLVFQGVHVVRKHRWSDLIAAADVVVPSTTTGSETLLDVLAVGRAVVAPAIPRFVALVVPSSAGLVYRMNDAAAMSTMLLRLLTMPRLCGEMSCRARTVARERLRRNRPVHQAERMPDLVN